MGFPDPPPQSGVRQTLPMADETGAIATEVSERQAVAWGLALVTAPLVPTLVFWVRVVVNLATGGSADWQLPGVSLGVLLAGCLLALVRPGGLRGLGVGLAVGAVPCLIWTTWTA